jgi:hypothetical protein
MTWLSVPAMSCPMNAMPPDVGARTPVIMLIIVLFPAPLGPISA